MDLTLIEILPKLEEQLKYHQTQAKSYLAIIEDIRKEIPPKSNMKRGAMSEEHKKKLREAHAKRKKDKQDAKERLQREEAQQKLNQDHIDSHRSV